MNTGITDQDALHKEVDRLRREVARYRGIFDQLPIGTYVYHLEDRADDRTLRMVAANSIVAELTGVSPDTIVGKTLDENFPGLREQGVPQAFAEVIRTGVPFAHEVVYGDERVIESAFMVHATPLPDNCIAVLFENITARKNAEQQLRNLNAELEQRVAEQTTHIREQGEKYRTLIETISDWVWEVDQHGRYTYTSPQVRAMLGYAPHEILGKTPFDLMAPDEAARIGATFAHIATQQQEFHELVTTCIHRDGHPVTFEVSGVPFFAPDGSLAGYRGSDRDVTARMQQEADLRTFKALIEHAPDGVCVLDPQTHTISYANQAYAKLVQQTDHELDGSYGGDLFDLDAEQFAAIGAAVHAHECWQGVVACRRKDGSTVATLQSLFLIKKPCGQAQALAVMARDNSQQQRQEHELRMFKTLVENAPDAISVATLEGVQVYVNPVFQERTGYGQQAVGMRVPDFYRESPAVIEQVVAHIKEHGFWQGENTYRCADGQMVPNLASIYLVCDDQGTPQFTAAIEKDLRQQRQAEAERDALQQQVIDAQRAALRELSTPLIPLTDAVVIMPLVGAIDSQRAQMVLETLLDGVAQYRATLAIIDITGVSVVDTQVAQAFVLTAQAVRMLGAQVMLTGIQPQIAQTLVHLGVGLDGIQTRGSLQAGIAAALQHTNRL